MGTRSNIKFYSEEEDCIASIYQQYDGYPECVGLELAQFLASKTLINGISGQTLQGFANGMGCLAAQFIAHVKTGIGSVYMAVADDTEEYNYFVHPQSVIVTSYNEILFQGTWAEFYEFCKKEYDK